MADGRDLDSYNSQSHSESTKYQSTGRTNFLTRSTNGCSLNGLAHSANLAKPSVFDFNFKTNVCPTCQGTGRVPKGERPLGWLVRLPVAPQLLLSCSVIWRIEVCLGALQHSVHLALRNTRLNRRSVFHWRE